MNRKYVVALICILLSSQSLAFQCYLTFAKDNCWFNYTVNLTLSDAQNKKVLAEFTIPAGKSWVRQAFECQPSQSLNATTTYSPKIWESDTGKSYNILNYIFLPDSTNANQSAWEVPVCFSKAFASVPLPPASSGNCQCDFKSIPAILPKVL